MSDTKTPPSRDALLKHLKTVENESLKLEGSPKINPYLYVKRNVTPLVEEVNKAKEITSELANKVLAVKPCVEPK